MTWKLRLFLISIIHCAGFLNNAFADAQDNPPPYIAKVLNWVPETSACSSCKGHFAEPRILIDNPNPKNPNQLPSEITATGPSRFASNGVSILTQNVVLTQPGRIVKADKAYIYRNGKTKKITHIHLVGHVRMMEHGKLIVAKTADFYPLTDEWFFEKPIYHVSENTLPSIPLDRYHYEAWGLGDSAQRDKNAVIHLKNASYTTCSPVDPTWQIYAKTLLLDHKEGRGYAYNIRLHVKRVPLFYWPYLNFPLDNRRHSGFLTPSMASSKERGFEIDVPYYWNMAPNFDMTITPKIMTSRGFSETDLFRYLLPNSEGHFFEALNPYDLTFHRFVQRMLNQYQNQPAFAPFITELNSDKEQYWRGFFNMENTTQISPSLSASWVFNYVSDDYYLRDYGSTFSQMYANQLLNEFDLNYDWHHWTAKVFFQSYQTLHLIDQLPAPNTQYERLPEMDISTHYANIFHLFTYDSTSQFVNFAYSSIFPPFTFQLPVGLRYHGFSTVSLPINFASGYILPAISSDSTLYDSQSATAAANIPRANIQMGRALPVFDIDSGLYFQRYFDNNRFEQTFEPRLFYLYVPYLNQNNYPYFDTTLLPFTYDQLFATNRLSGFDRLENANQLSLGVISRIINENTGSEILNFGAGIEYYFQQPNVPIFNSQGQLVLPFFGKVSPLVSEITYYPWLNWSITGNLAWDFSNNSLNNAGTTISYSSLKNRIFSFSYLYANTYQGIPVQNFGIKQISQLVNAGISWPINRSVNILGYDYYDLSNNRQQSFYGGLEYSTCCWAFRAVVNRSLYNSSVVIVNGNSQVTNKYQTVYYVQFLLKGLGDAGNSDPSTLLTSTLPGYVDPFKSR